MPCYERVFLWTDNSFYMLHLADSFAGITSKLTVFSRTYSSQITNWSPQGMRVVRQCTVPRAEVMFVTIQHENIRPSKKQGCYNA
jgi:hypothetical protein